MLHAVIMAGGGGTRFWPRSRRDRPKQFLKLAGERTLLQAAGDRLEAQVPPERTWIFTSASHRDETARQLPHVPTDQIVGEPASRDTAPCVALAAALIARRNPQALMIVTPADHVIEPVQEFRRLLHATEQLAVENPHALITFGIRPTRPSTGYGYIRRGQALPFRQGVPVFRVESFREKPDEATAREYLASGNYYWNAGVFAGKASVFLENFAIQKPAMYDGVCKIAASWDQSNRDAIFVEEYSRIEKISFDFAIMEKAPEVLVLEATYHWDDVGSWLALERLYPHDANWNTVQATHCGVDTSNCIIVGDSDNVIATVGLQDLIIVQDGDCFLVADRRMEGDVKKLVEELRRRGLERYL